MIRSVFFLLLAVGAAAGHPSKPPPAVSSATFNATFSDHAVLQAMGTTQQKSAVYGMAPAGATLSITVASAADASYSVAATASAKGAWKAFLHPTADGGDFTITAHCSSCASNATNAVLRHVTFGDVWYCSGQSK